VRERQREAEAEIRKKKNDREWRRRIEKGNKKRCCDFKRVHLFLMA
jgi:hypothetical protein